MTLVIEREAPYELAPVVPQTEPIPEPVVPGHTKTNSLLIIAESGDLERTWATTILASSAAASGMEVSIFFTFWGFFPLVRPEKRITGENWMQKMLSVMNRPGIDHLRTSRLNMFGMGPWMMKRLAKRYGVAEPGELLQAAIDLGVKILPCQMSMDMLGFKREDLIEGLGEPVGAATVLGMIAEGTPALFI
jgi:peroxiredoxin family protein